MVFSDKIIRRLKQALLFFEDSNLLDYFDNTCIFFGSCILMLLNDTEIYPNKFNILCTWNKFKILNQYLMNNDFQRKRIILKKKYKFTYCNDDHNFIFKIFIDEIPILNIKKYVKLKIEEIYYDTNIGYNYAQELLKKKEKISIIDLHKIENHIKLFKKISKYTKYNYNFIIYDDDQYICVYDKNHHTLKSTLSRLFNIIRCKKNL
jgi:hypothetical protein